MRSFWLAGLQTLLLTVGALGTDPVHAFDIVNRWTETQTDGGGIERGDPITLFWSIVPDGESYDRSANSNLIEFLDDGWNIDLADRTPDLMNRAWWSIMNSAYDQYTNVSGIRMVYIAEQDALGQDTGRQGDIRIGGEPFDTNPNVNVLADNTFPNGGDMRIDTTPDAFYSASNVAGFRNLISHESGHGVGLGHSVISGAESVMEGGIQSHFYGLQFDDVYAFNRLYGDPLEKRRGNDSMDRHYDLGDFTASTSMSLGTSAVDSVVEQSDVDWLGIDGDTDEDWFRFHVSSEAVVDIRITPLGPTYEAQGATFEAHAQSNLKFEVYGDDGSLLRAVDDNGIGLAEQIEAQTLTDPGEYFLRVVGDADANQFYQLDVDANLPDLRLTVNRDTGEIRMSGIGDGIGFDGYRIESASGSLIPSDGTWSSLADQQLMDWREANPSTSSLRELLPMGTTQLSDADLVDLGTPYSQNLTAPFGTVEEGDVTFSYLTPATGDEWQSGAVEFVGNPYYNNLVLTIDPATGETLLGNESDTIVDLDGYSITSDSGSLSPGTWSSLEDQGASGWRESNPNEDRLSELNPIDTITLMPGDVLSLGTVFDVLGVQDVELSFLLPGDEEFRDGVVIFASPGDYDRDGDVDADDYMVWRQTFSSTQHLAADGNRDQVVNLSDYTVWRDHLGIGSGSSVASSTVPEHKSLSYLLVSLGATCIYGRTVRACQACAWLVLTSHR